MVVSDLLWSDEVSNPWGTVSDPFGDDGGGGDYWPDLGSAAGGIWGEATGSDDGGDIWGTLTDTVDDWAPDPTVLDYVTDYAGGDEGGGGIFDGLDGIVEVSPGDAVDGGYFAETWQDDSADIGESAGGWFSDIGIITDDTIDVVPDDVESGGGWFGDLLDDDVVDDASAFGTDWLANTVEQVPLVATNAVDLIDDQVGVFTSAGGGAATSATEIATNVADEAVDAGAGASAGLVDALDEGIDEGMAVATAAGDSLPDVDDLPDDIMGTMPDIELSDMPVDQLGESAADMLSQNLDTFGDEFGADAPLETVPDLGVVEDTLAEIIDAPIDDFSAPLDEPDSAGNAFPPSETLDQA